ARVARRACRDVAAGIRVQDAGYLPSAQRMADEAFLVLEERKVVNIVGSEDVTTVVVEVAVFGANVGRILRGAVIAGRGTESVRPGVIENHHRVLGEVLGERRLQAVVVGGEHRREEIDGSVALVRADLVKLLGIAGAYGTGDAESLESAQRRLVDVNDADEVTSGPALVAEIEDNGRLQLLLHVHAPHHRVRLLPVGSTPADVRRREIRS